MAASTDAAASSSAGSNASVLPDGPVAKLGKPIVFSPPAGTACEGAVIWMHGFGDKPDGWAQLLRPLRRAAPKGLKWVHLRAPPLPQPCFKGQSLPGWGQFFSIKPLKKGSLDHEHEDEAGYYAASARAVIAEVQRLGREDGVSPEKVLVAGFSQGGAMALESSLCFGKRLAGIMALACWMTPRARKALKANGTQGMPILLGHGTADEMCGFECAEFAASLIGEAAPGSLDFETFKGLRHTSSPKMMRVVASFVQKALFPGTAELKVPEWEKGGTAFGSDGEDESDEPEVLYVKKAALDKIRDLLKADGDLAKDVVQAPFMDLRNMEADGMMAPLAVETVEKEIGNLDDPGNLDAALSKLGGRGFALKLVAAADSADKAGVQSITFERWLEIYQQQAGSDGEEGGEEELLEDSEEEEQEEDEDASEPAAKRSRT